MLCNMCNKFVDPLNMETVPEMEISNVAETQCFYEITYLGVPF